MYRIDVIYEDESTFTLEGVGKYVAIGMLKDALDGTLSGDDRDVIGIHVSPIPWPVEEQPEV